MKPIARLVVATVGVALVAPAHAQIDCAAWNTKSFFLAAEVSDVTRCLQTGMDPEARSESGYTPLHWAASSGNAEAIEVLIAAGANPEARSESGYTPLNTAANSGNAEAIEVLIAAGANLEARSESGYTPLNTAANSGNAEAIEVLIAAGANLEARDEGDRTPLNWAAYLGDSEAIEVLIAAGANPAARSESGLHPAAYGCELWGCRKPWRRCCKRGQTWQRDPKVAPPRCIRRRSLGDGRNHGGAAASGGKPGSAIRKWLHPAAYGGALWEGRNHRGVAASGGKPGSAS